MRNEQVGAAFRGILAGVSPKVPEPRELNTTAEIMAAMRFDGAVVTIERLQAHALRLEALLKGAA